MSGRWLVLGSIILAACGGGEAGGAGEASVRDSAGIQIVENTGPELPEGSGWTLSAEPLMSVGGDVTNPANDFNRVVGAVRLSDGRVAVADGASNEIRVFGPDGAHQTSVGRTGEGPGEYQIMAGLWHTDTDSIVVLDVAIRRLTVLGPTAEYGRSFSLGGMGGAMIPGADGSVNMSIPAGVLDDGSLIGMANTFRINDTREGAFRDPLPLIRYGPDGAVRDTVAEVPGLEMEMMTMSFAGQSFSSPTPVSLGKQTLAVARGSRLYVATNEAWEVEAREADGTLRALFRVGAAPRPLAEADIATHRQEQRDLVDAQPGMSMAPQELKDQIYERINVAPYPTTLPFIANLLVDDTGHLWAQEVSRPGDLRQRWGVFTPEGRLVTWLVMPERFRPTHITTDAIVGIWQDPDDVEHVRVYGLTRG